jgi:hypothetical protein
MPTGEPVTKNEVEQLFTANKKEMEQLFTTKSDLDQALSATTEEFKKIFATKADLDRPWPSPRAILSNCLPIKPISFLKPLMRS